MSSIIRIFPLSKRTLFIFGVGAILLAIAAYGFWSWMNDAPNLIDPSPGHLFCIASLAIVPTTLFVILAIRMALGMGHMSSSMGFQTRIDQLQKRLNAQDDFFHLVTDHTSSSLTVFNTDHEYWFVNACAAREMGAAANSDFLGKKPIAVLGPKRGGKIETDLAKVLGTGKPVEALHNSLDESGRVRYVQASYQPLAPFGEFPGGVMLCEENVTGILVERERREDMFRQVIGTLVAVVDRRDPYAAGHSSRVGQLSKALAVEMHLDATDAEAAEIGGTLMNFGKVLVSRAILTKTESLTPDELQRIRDGILTSADILSMIDFKAPVVPTLRQVFERFDGTGSPLGLTGEGILVTARIVAVANAFIAMVSPRAYRPGVEFSIAVQRLAQDAGTAFDPRVIAALESFLRKNKDKLDWLAGTK